MTLQPHESLFPRSQEPASGSWVLCYSKGRPAANLYCPICSAVASVPHDVISATGSIDGPVYCSSVSCRWFGYVSLLAWAEAVGG